MRRQDEPVGRDLLTLDYEVLWGGREGKEEGGREGGGVGHKK